MDRRSFLSGAAAASLAFAPPLPRSVEFRVEICPVPDVGGGSGARVAARAEHGDNARESGEEHSGDRQ